MAKTDRDAMTVESTCGNPEPAKKAKAKDSFVTTPARRSLIKDLKRSPAATAPFKDFWKAYEPLVRMKCGNKGLRAQEIEDVVEEVKLAVLGSIKTYRKKKGAFHSWLGTITHYKIMDVLRIRIPYERKHVQVDNDDKLQWLMGQPNASGDTTKRGNVKDKTNPTKEATSHLISDTAMAGLHGKVRKTAGPATLVCVEEEREIAKSILKRVAKKVSDRQWQIFQAAVVRNKPVAGICKALEVTENQVYIARNRVGKIYNAELDSVGREIGKDLQQYKIPKAKKPESASK